MQEDNKLSKPFLLIVALAVTVLIVGAIAYTLSMTNNSKSTHTANQTKASGDTQTAPSTTMPTTITYTNDGASPKTLSVKKGAEVTIQNDSDQQVEFSSDDHPTHTKNSEINTKPLAAGEHTTFTVTKVGTYGFHDHQHPSDIGTLVVTE